MADSRMQRELHTVTIRKTLRSRRVHAATRNAALMTAFAMAQISDYDQRPGNSDH
jgi:hypothetical protein